MNAWKSFGSDAANETENDEVIPPPQTPNAPNEIENDEVIPPPQTPNIESMFLMCLLITQLLHRE